MRGEIDTGEDDRDRPTTFSFRPDIDGLRAVAVVLVVAYHGLVPGFGGGFVGVDVFFVISGFLITSLLLRELEAGEGISFRSFWARRVRRLVPGLTLVNAVALLGAAVVLTPLLWSSVVKEVLASTLYVSNYFYANQAQDYFAAGIPRNLLLHTWSLGVEEQFYLLWPLLMAGAAGGVGRGRREGGARRRLVLALGAVSLGSFAVSVVTTSNGDTWSFYGLPSRAWEFGVAGLLACLLRWSSGGGARARAVAGWSGAAALVVSVVVIDESTMFPGSAALLPVVATLLLIGGGAAGASASPWTVSALLARRPMQAVGRLSYAWYLWHWPAVVLATAKFGGSSTVRSAAAFGAIVPAYAAYRWVERPMRQMRWAAPNRRSFQLLAVSTLVVVVLAFSTLAIGRHEIRSDPLLASLDAAGRSPRYTDLHCPAPILPASEKLPAGWCQFGAPAAARTVVVIGDSHAEQWAASFDRAAGAQRLRVLLKWNRDCPFNDVTITLRYSTTVPDRRCAEVVAEDRRSIAAIHPDAVVISNWAGYVGRVADGAGVVGTVAEQRDRWTAGLDRTVGQIESEGTKAAVVLDSPSFVEAPILCAADAGSIAACDPSRADALSSADELRRATAAAASATGAAVIDAASLTCTVTSCPAALDSEIVYKDQSHVTADFALTRSSQIEDFLARLLPPVDASP